MKANFVGRDISQAVIERVDAQLGVLAILRHGHARHELPAVRQVGVVDLKQEAGVDDGLVLFVHGVGDGEQIGFIVGVIVVLHPMFDGAGRDGGEKCLLVLLSLEARFEITDFLLQPLLADILERPVAENSLDVVTAIMLPVRLSK